MRAVGRSAGGWETVRGGTLLLSPGHRYQKAGANSREVRLSVITGATQRIGRPRNVPEPSEQWT
jgi:hypothetical protein